MDEQGVIDQMVLNDQGVYKRTGLGIEAIRYRLRSCVNKRYRRVL